MCVYVCVYIYVGMYICMYVCMYVCIFNPRYGPILLLVGLQANVGGAFCGRARGETIPEGAPHWEFLRFKVRVSKFTCG